MIAAISDGTLAAICGLVVLALVVAERKTRP